MDFDRAVVVASAAFYLRHPSEALPAWFHECVTVGGSMAKDKSWTVQFFVHPILELASDEHWEEINGRPCIIRTDPITKERKVIISIHGEPPIVFFRVFIDKKDEMPQILLDEDFSKIDGSTIVHTRKSDGIRA